MKLIHRCSNHEEFEESFYDEHACARSRPGFKYVNHDDPDFTTIECLGCGELWKYRRNHSDVVFWSHVRIPINWQIPSKFQTVDQKTPTINIGEVKERRFEIIDRGVHGGVDELPFFSAYENDVKATARVIARNAFSIGSRRFRVTDIEELKKMDLETKHALAETIAFPIQRAYDYQAIGRKLCMVEELPQGAMQTYER